MIVTPLMIPVDFNGDFLSVCCCCYI